MLHMLCAYWSYILLSIHLGLHWQTILSLAGRLFKNTSPVISRVTTILGYCAALYGVAAFF